MKSVGSNRSRRDLLKSNICFWSHQLTQILMEPKNRTLLMLYSPRIDRSMPNSVKIKRGKICYTSSCDTITEIRCQLSPLQSNTVVMSGRSPGFQINATPILVTTWSYIFAVPPRSELCYNRRQTVNLVSAGRTRRAEFQEQGTLSKTKFQIL